MVQVFVADQDVLFDSHRAWDVLSIQEKERAERFVFERDKHNFIVAHGVKRIILARHLGVHPASLRFVHSPMGKPALVGLPLHFNLSHSYGLMALSISEHDPVGVDIEVMRDSLDPHSLATRFFAGEESDDIGTDASLFYRYWVAKEAILKAEGEGIADHLANVVLNVDESGSLTIKSLPASFANMQSWYLHEFVPAENALAAVASPADVGGVEIMKLKFV